MLSLRNVRSQLSIVHLALYVRSGCPCTMCHFVLGHYYCRGCVSKSKIHTDWFLHLYCDFTYLKIKKGCTATVVLIWLVQPQRHYTTDIYEETCWCSLELSNCWENCSMKWFPVFCSVRHINICFLGASSWKVQRPTCLWLNPVRTLSPVCPALSHSVLSHRL